mmetsp:Transcript_37330/g.69694  ORF Transcript_37330/g.69694 Transcript_37330/m.69694 type:complete len:174 (-) Transcript_37330:214-735(-)
MDGASEEWCLAVSAAEMTGWTDKKTVRVVEVGVPPRRVLLAFTTTATVYALDALCGHRGGPLESGDLEDIPGLGTCVRCPWHGRQYLLETGNEVLSDGGLRPSQRVFETELRNGALYIRLAVPGRLPSDDFAEMKQAPSAKTSLHIWLEGRQEEARPAASAPQENYISDEFLF